MYLQKEQSWNLISWLLRCWFLSVLRSNHALCDFISGGLTFHASLPSMLLLPTPFPAESPPFACFGYRCGSSLSPSLHHLALLWQSLQLQPGSKQRILGLKTLKDGNRQVRNMIFQLATVTWTVGELGALLFALVVRPSTLLDHVQIWHMTEMHIFWNLFSCQKCLWRYVLSSFHWSSVDNHEPPLSCLVDSLRSPNHDLPGCSCSDC